MISDDGSAADRRDTDLLLRPLLSPSGAIVYVLISAPARFIADICKGNRCSAGRIQFLIVVLLDNLDIKSRLRQRGRRFGKDLEKHVYAERHIRGAENGNLFRGLLHLPYLLFRKSGCAENERDFLLLRIGKESVRRLCIREVNDDIRALLYLAKAPVNRKCAVGFTEGIHACNNRQIRIGPRQFRNHMSHTPAGAVKKNIYHTKTHQYLLPYIPYHYNTQLLYSNILYN